MTLADYLTILRLILVPIFLVSFLNSQYTLAFVFFAIAGGTDLIDGTIARWQKRETKLGAFLDPIADKALMMTTLICLLALKIVPLWFCLLIVMRDIFILAGLAYLGFKKISFELKPVLSSKFGTLSNITVVVFGFLNYLYPSPTFLTQPFHFWFQVFLWTSTLLVLVSSGQYFYIGFNMLNKKSLTNPKT